MKELDFFIEKLAEAIEEDSVESLSQETNFRDLEGWTSLSMLSVIAMMDEEYNVQIESQDLKTLFTIGDLFDAIKSK